MAGKHVIVDFYGCQVDLDNETMLKDILLNAAAISNGSILDVVSHKFLPQGVSVLVLISESHLSIHTYPEYNVAFVDIFTCGKKCNPIKAARYLEKQLRPSRSIVKKVNRSIRFRNNVAAEV